MQTEMKKIEHAEMKLLIQQSRSPDRKYTMSARWESNSSFLRWKKMQDEPLKQEAKDERVSDP